MILGAINFNLHFWIWNKEKKEFFKNFEIRIFMFTLVILSAVLFYALRADEPLRIFREGFYQIVSAHTGCGFTNLAYNEINGFRPLGIAAIMMAMAIGGGMCSTTGGIKLLRLGFIFKALMGEVKKALMPFKAVYKERYHHLRDSLLEEKYIKEAFVIVTFYFLAYFIGGLIAMAFNYPTLSSFFESISAAANVGLSVGITNPSMPALLKVVFIFQMWMGRLEFLSIFIALGYVFSLLKK